MKKNIAILAGGNSSEREISLLSAATIAENLDSEKYNYQIIDINGLNWTLQSEEFKHIHVNKNDFSLSVNNYSRTQFDCAFLAIHGAPGEDGQLQAYFNLVGIPYSTGDVLSLSLSFNKYFCNTFLRQLGILLPNSLTVTRDTTPNPAQIIEKLGLPLFIKPSSSGSSFGVSKVKNANEILPAIKKALSESNEALIEEYIEGLEVSCGLVKTSEREIVFPVTEIVSKNEFFDYEAKYNSSQSEEITPARIPDIIRDEVQAQASKIYDMLQCRGIVRMDFIIKNSKIYFLESNSVPGMTKNSIVPKQIQAMGMNLKEVLTMVIEDCMQKSSNQPATN